MAIAGIIGRVFLGGLIARTAAIGDPRRPVDVPSDADHPVVGKER